MTWRAIIGRSYPMDDVMEPILVEPVEEEEQVPA